MVTISSATAEIARVGGHYAIRGHLRSTISASVESMHVTHMSLLADVTYPGTNRARCRVIKLIGTNTLPLRHAATNGRRENKL